MARVTQPWEAEQALRAEEEFQRLTGEEIEEVRRKLQALASGQGDDTEEAYLRIFDVMLNDRIPDEVFADDVQLDRFCRVEDVLDEVLDRKVRGRLSSN